MPGNTHQEGRCVNSIALRVTDNDCVTNTVSGRGLRGRSRGRRSRGLQLRTDSESLLFELVELSSRVGSEHHSGTAVRVSEISILRAVHPDGVCLQRFVSMK